MRSTILGVVCSILAMGCASAQPEKPAVPAKPAATTAKAQGVGANVRLTEKMLGAWQSPKPPVDAQKATTAGSGRTKVNTANGPDDTDSFWVVAVDIDGDGTVETAAFLYDDEDKVLYIYASHEFPCKGGGTSAGEMLIAVNAKGNARKKPPGSGWYVVALNAGECGAKAEGLYGCHFDEKGKATNCGSATLDEKNDELIVTAVE